MASVRKSMPPPSKSFKDKKKYDRKSFKSFKDFYEEEMGTLGAANTTPPLDSSHVAETMYSDGQDETVPSVQSIADAVDKEQLIQDIIGDLEELKGHDWSQPLNKDVIKAMAQTLRQAGVEPTDFDAAVNASPEKQKQYLITGPSSWKGGKGALNDLKAILAGNEPQEVTNEQETLTPQDIHALADKMEIEWDNNPEFMELTKKLTGKEHLDDLNQKELQVVKDYLEGLQEDESNPAADLPMGSTSAGDALSETFEGIYENILKGENFMDKRGPGRPGDSKRHGIKKGTSLSQLDKIVKSKTASPRKKQLAHWQANMRRGKAKKK